MNIIIKIFCLLIVFLVLGLGLFIFANFMLTQPMYEGKVIHNREDIGDITIQREQPYGIPHIKADNFRDTLYGLGYVHSQDRLFSMHVKRRCAQGRLSEFGGKQTLETDIFFRSVGIADTIKKVVKNIDEETKHNMQAYVNGINDQVKQMKMLPLEFQIIGESFEDWTLEDCISIELMLNLFLSLDFYFEPIKALVREKYGHELAEEIFAMRDHHLFEKTFTLDDEDLKQSGIYKQFLQEELDNHARHLRDIHKVDHTHLLENFIKMTQIELLENNYSQMKGSNAWVVDGNLTATGKPILANDPHLDIIIPSFWYQTELLFEHENKKKYVIGASVAGMPVIALGRTAFIGWGITNNMSDSNDLYVEKIKGDKYFFDGEWVQMKSREETIKIGKSGEEKNITIYETHHGPVLPSMLDLLDFENPFENHSEYSLCWPGHQSANNFIKSNHKVIVSEDMDEIENLFRDFSDPIINVLYATVDGDIGYIATGRQPVRPDPLNFYPLDGTNKENDWIRFYKGSEQPQVRNPKKHFIINSNNKVATDNLNHHITATATTHGRSYRINQFLTQQIESGKKFTVEDMMKYQMDRVDSYCVDVKPDIMMIFEKYQDQYFQKPEDQEKINIFKKIFNDWNCEMAPFGEQAVGASIYGIWEQKMLSKYFNNLTDDQYLNHRASMNLMFDHFFFHRIQDWAKGQKIGEFYCITESNQKDENPCLFNFFESWVETYDVLQEFFPGKPQSAWQWGDISVHRFMHKPFSDTPLRPFFGIDRPGAGNRRTVNVGGVNLAFNKWKSLYSANYRMVLDMSDEGKNYYVQETGQSESIFSQHYSDQMDLLLQGKLIEMKLGHENFGSYQQTLSLLRQDNKTKQSDL